MIDAATGAALLEPFVYGRPRGGGDGAGVAAASHVAFASLRMEPTLMMLGHAAGLAAAQAARQGVAVQDVDVEALQRSLLDRGAVLSP